MNNEKAREKSNQKYIQSVSFKNNTVSFYGYYIGSHVRARYNISTKELTEALKDHLEAVKNKDNIERIEISNESGMAIIKFCLGNNEGYYTISLYYLALNELISKYIKMKMDKNMADIKTEEKISFLGDRIRFYCGDNEVGRVFYEMGAGELIGIVAINANLMDDLHNIQGVSVFKHPKTAYIQLYKSKQAQANAYSLTVDYKELESWIKKYKEGEKEEEKISFSGDRISFSCGDNEVGKTFYEMDTDELIGILASNSDLPEDLSKIKGVSIHEEFKKACIQLYKSKQAQGHAYSLIIAYEKLESWIKKHKEDSKKVRTKEIPADLYEKLLYLGIVSDGDTTRESNVGASNYAQTVIQPWAVALDHKLCPLKASMCKRLLRKKGGNEREDMEKIIHEAREWLRADEVRMKYPRIN